MSEGPVAPVGPEYQHQPGQDPESECDPEAVGRITVHPDRHQPAATGRDRDQEELEAGHQVTDEQQGGTDKTADREDQSAGERVDREAEGARDQGQPGGNEEHPHRGEGQHDPGETGQNPGARDGTLRKDRAVAGEGAGDQAAEWNATVRRVATGESGETIAGEREAAPGEGRNHPVEQAQLPADEGHLRDPDPGTAPLERTEGTCYPGPAEPGEQESLHSHITRHPHV